MQYTAEGTLMGSVQSKEQITAGTDFSTLVTLTPATNCQLVVIVRGKGNTTPSIGGQPRQCATTGDGRRSFQKDDSRRRFYAG